MIHRKTTTQEKRVPGEIECNIVRIEHSMNPYMKNICSSSTNQELGCEKCLPIQMCSSENLQVGNANLKEH